MMRTATMLLALILVVSCRSDSATESPAQTGCPPDNPPAMAPCARAPVVRTEGDDIVVTVVITTRAKQEYERDGYLCVRTVWHCLEKTCIFDGQAGKWSNAYAVSQCQAA